MSTSDGDGKCSEDNVVVTTAETKIETVISNGNWKLRIFFVLKILIVFLVVSSL